MSLRTGVFRIVAEFLLLLLPCGFTYFFIHLIGNYWAYYDIGINAGANSLTRLFCVVPLMLIAFYGVFGLSVLVALRFRLQYWMVIVSGIVGMLGLYVGAFLLQVRLAADYPRPNQHSLAEFLAYYISRGQ